MSPERLPLQRWHKSSATFPLNPLMRIKRNFTSQILWKRHHLKHLPLIYNWVWMHTRGGFSLFFEAQSSCAVFLFFNENRLTGWTLLWIAFSWRGMCCLCLPGWMFPCQESYQETLTCPDLSGRMEEMFLSHFMKKKKCTSQSRQYFLKPSLHSSLHGNLLLYFTLVRFIILLCGEIIFFFSCFLHCFCFTYLCVCSAVVDCSAFPHCRVS